MSSSSRVLLNTGNLMVIGRVIYNETGDAYTTYDSTTNNIVVAVGGTTSAVFTESGLNVGGDTLVVKDETVGIGTTEPDPDVELHVSGMARVGILELDRDIDSTVPRSAIGDLGYLFSALTPGFGIDNQLDIGATPGLDHDIRMWFPKDRNEDAVIFNTSPEVHTAGLQIKKDNADVSNIFMRFCTGTEFNIPTADLGGIISHGGYMGFYNDTTDITNADILLSTSGIDAITSVNVYEYGSTIRTGVSTLGFDYADISNNPLFYLNENAVTTINNRKLVVPSNLLPYCWAAIQNLTDRVIGLELAP